MTDFYGAGVLTYSFNNVGERVFLLGKEANGTNSKRNNLFCDFGGGKEDGETPEECAFREFIEETLDVLGHRDEVKASLQDPSGKINSDGYVQFLVKVEYDDVSVQAYNPIMNQLVPHMVAVDYREHKTESFTDLPEGMAEKVELRWFTMQEILVDCKEKMRPAFYNTFLNLMETVDGSIQKK